jgi:hypothetical protein
MAKFGTAITCIDGRVQEPVAAWLKARYYLDYVDMVTEAGADLVMAAGAPEDVARLQRNVQRSVEKHGSTVIALVGHHDCAANPGPEEQHVAQLAAGLHTIRLWNLSATVLALWVNEDWQIELAG